MTHYLQSRNAWQPQAFRDYAVEAMGEAEVRRVQETYRRGGVELTWDGAMDEVAANYTEKLLTDEDAVRRLIRDDRSLAQKILDAIRGLVQKVTGKEGAKLRQAEKLWSEMFRDIAGQEQADHGTMGVRYSGKEDNGNDSGRTQQDDAGGVQQNYSGATQADRRTRGKSGGNGAVLSRRGMSRGQQPVHGWAEKGLIVPKIGSVAESEARVVQDEYRLPVFVVKRDIFNRNHPKAPAFASEGQVFLREDLPEIGLGDIGAHEAGHAMKQLGYQPYLDWIEQTPDLMDITTDEAQMILEHAAKHADIDLFNMVDKNTVDLYDEVNNIVYGAIHAGRMEVLDLIRPAFPDFDAYAAALSSIHEQFKAEQAKTDATAQKNTAPKDGSVRFSIKRDQNDTPYVEVEEDILAGIPKSQWVKTVKDNLRKQFPDGVTVGNNVININAQSRREMTFSKYMQRLFNLEPQMYTDKLRATNNADEILRAARNWVNEALLHPRKDDIIDFARGEVLMRIGSNDYTAQVIVGNRGQNGLLLYDIINLAPATIREKTKKTDAAFTTNTQNGPRSRGPASVTTSISKTGGDVNGRFSLKQENRRLTGAELQHNFAMIDALAKKLG